MTNHPTIECPNCGLITLEHQDTISMKGSPDLQEYICSTCKHYQVFPINSTYVPVHLRNQAS